MTTRVPEPGGGASVRQARRTDLVSIDRIEQASFPQPWPYSAFESYLGEPGFLVADGPTDGEVVGYVVADTIPNNGTPLGHVKDIAVADGHRRRGIGTTLLDRSLTVLSETGAPTVKLEVRASNERAISLYEGFGFEHRRTVPGYYGNDDDAFVMVAPLD